MLNLSFLISLTLWGLAGAQIDSRCFIENLSFEANYEIEYRVKGSEIYRKRIQEQYVSRFAASKIRLQDKAQGSNREFLYFGNEHQVDIETNDTAKGEYLARLINGKLLTDVLLSTKDDNNKFEIFHDIEPYFEPNYFETIKSKFSHIRGLSQLILLIDSFKEKVEETPKDSFEDMLFPGKLEGKITYKLENLKNHENNDINKNLNIELAIPKISECYEGIDKLKNFLRCIPNGIVIKNSGDNFRELRIRLHTFEILKDADIWKNNKLSTISNLLLPLGTSDAIKSISYKSVNEKESLYTFKGSMVGDIPLSHPVELDVTHDGISRKLSYETSIVNPSQVEDQENLRVRSQYIFDIELLTKFHIIPSKFVYAYPIEIYDQNYREPSWRSCVTAQIDEREAKNIELHGAEVIRTNGATFVGYSMVRGIPCYVLEKKLFSLPPWLEIGVNYGTLMQGDVSIYLRIFKLIQGSSKTGLDVSPIVRLSLLVMKDQESTNYVVDMEQFSWSISHSKSFQLHRVDLDEQCFLSHEHLRHLYMSLMIEPQSDRDKKNLEKIDSDTLSDTLLKLLKFSFAQKANWESNWVGHSGRLQARFSLYELPMVHETRYEYKNPAKDGSVGSSLSGKWSVGTTSLSTKDCMMNLAHSIEPSEKSSTGDTRIFMYCHRTLHCVFGDSSWTNQMTKNNGIKIASQVEYPIMPHEDKDGCRIYSYQLNYLNPNQVPQNYRLSEVNNQIQGLIGTKLEIEGSDFDETIKAKIVDASSEYLSISRDREILKKLEGLKYSTAEDNVHGFKVQSLAQCKHLCLTHHDCGSFSLCRLDVNTNFECLLSVVNLTDPQTLNGLPRVSQSQKVMLKVYLTNQTSVDIEIEGSKGCTIHPRHSMDIFDYERRLTHIINRDNTIITRSAEECANFCIERANTVKSIEEKTIEGSDDHESMIGSKNQDTTCVVFKYSRERGLCYMEPKLNVTELIMLSPSIEQEPLVARWIEAKKSVDDAIRFTNYFDFEEYKLGSSIFESKNAIRFNAATSDDESLQMNYGNMVADECARKCLTNRECLSFDLDTSESASQPICFLNFADTSKYPLIETSSDWTHYELTDQGLYIAGRKLRNQSRNIKRVGLFLSADQEIKSDKESNVQDGSSEERPGWLKFVRKVCIALVVIILIFMVFVYLIPCLRRNGYCSCNFCPC